MNYPVIFKHFIIQNIVGSCNVNFKINLRKLYNYFILFSSQVMYETELFPGLIYYYLDENQEKNEQKANIVFLIFNSGRIVISGAKNKEQINKSFGKVLYVLHKFELNSNT